MKTKEKAKELVSKMKKWQPDRFWEKEHSKQCALLCVDEIIKENGFYKDSSKHTSNGRLYFWQEVKQEIEKL